MPLVAAEMKSKMKTAIAQGLARVHPDVLATAGYADVSKAQFEKLADAISDIAMVIVEEITTNAIVVPGIPVSTSGGPGSTVGPGQIK